jgi:hypothetical protein
LPTLVKDIGPILGLVSFAVFLTLLVLYVLKAREIRQVRKAAPFLAEGNGKPETMSRRARRKAERRGGVAP